MVNLKMEVDDPLASALDANLVDKIGDAVVGEGDDRTSPLTAGKGKK